MILQAWDKHYVSSTINSGQEAELFYSLKNHLSRAGVLKREHIPCLVRYVKMQAQFIDLLQSNPKHYMLDKYANHLCEIEKELCLTPSAMLKYKKDSVLMQAKKQKLQNG